MQLCCFNFLNFFFSPAFFKILKLSGLSNMRNLSFSITFWSRILQLSSRPNLPASSRVSGLLKFPSSWSNGQPMMIHWRYATFVRTCVMCALLEHLPPIRPLSNGRSSRVLRSVFRSVWDFPKTFQKTFQKRSKVFMMHNVRPGQIAIDHGRPCSVSNSLIQFSVTCALTVRQLCQTAADPKRSKAIRQPAGLENTHWIYLALVQSELQMASNWYKFTYVQAKKKGWRSALVSLCVPTVCADQLGDKTNGARHVLALCAASVCRRPFGVYRVSVPSERIRIRQNLLLTLFACKPNFFSSESFSSNRFE